MKPSSPVRLKQMRSDIEKDANNVSVLDGKRSRRSKLTNVHRSLVEKTKPSPEDAATLLRRGYNLLLAWKDADTDSEGLTYFLNSALVSAIEGLFLQAAEQLGIELPEDSTLEPPANPKEIRKMTQRLAFYLDLYGEHGVLGEIFGKDFGDIIRGEVESGLKSKEFFG